MAKSSLEKYYISEKYDEERNISFNFKKANEKKFINFKEFVDAVAEFIKVSEISSKKTRVWFHKNGAYYGSSDLEKAYIILERFKGERIVNEEAIEYIEKENLVDKPTPKNVTNLNEEAKKLKFFVEEVHKKKASDVTIKEIKYESKFEVIIEEVREVKNEVLVTYHLEKDGEKSNTFEYKITGFFVEEVKEKPCCCVEYKCEKCQELKAKEAKKELKEKKENKLFWLFFTLLLMLTITNIVLIVLRVTNIL